MRTLLCSVVVLFLIQATTVSAGGPFGEFSLGIGGTYPQGNFNEWADPGVAGSLKLNFRLNKVKALSGWFGFGVTGFDSNRKDVDIVVDNVPDWGEKELNKYSVALHIGVQLGSDTRRGLFRPHAGIAPGFYFFNSNTKFWIVGTDEPFFDETDTQARFGWKSFLGVDLFFAPKWGISFDFVHDQVVNLHNISETASKETGLQTVSKSARFHTFMIGVVIPLDLIEDNG